MTDADYVNERISRLRHLLAQYKWPGLLGDSKQSEIARELLSNWDEYVKIMGQLYPESASFNGINFREELNKLIFGYTRDQGGFNSQKQRLVREIDAIQAEIDRLMRDSKPRLCPRCEHPATIGDKFCGKCGTKLPG